MPATTIYTVGHSTLALEDFIALLKTHGVRKLVDVRTVPKSRHNPQFRKENLAVALREAVPWRCHRSLIGDALLVRGVQVLDILSPTSVKPHTMTSFAKVQGKRITYPQE